MYVLSNAYYQLKNYNKSICYGKKSLLNNTKYDAETYLILAYSYKEKLCYFEAKEHCQKGLLLLQEGSAVDKNYLSNVYQTLAYLQMVLGEVAFARNNYKKASDLSGNLRDKLNNYSSYLMTLHYSDNLTTDFIFQEHLKFNEFFAEIKAYSHQVSPGGAQKLTAESMGVMLHVLNQQLRAQATGLKLQAQVAAQNNKKEKDSTSQYFKEINQLQMEIKDREFNFERPRF